MNYIYYDWLDVSQKLIGGLSLGGVLSLAITCGSGPLHMHGSYESKLGVSGPLLHMENMNSLYIFK